MTERTPGPWEVHGNHIFAKDVCIAVADVGEFSSPTVDALNAANARHRRGAGLAGGAGEDGIPIKVGMDDYGDLPCAHSARPPIAKAKGEA